MGSRFKVDVLSTTETASESPRLFRARFRAIPNGDDSITVQGWVLGEGSRVEFVELLDGQDVVGQSEVNIAWSGVADQFEDHPQAEKCGFRLIMEASQAGEGELMVRAILDDGTRVPMGSVRIRATREGFLQRLFERGSRGSGAPGASE